MPVPGHVPSPGTRNEKGPMSRVWLITGANSGFGRSIPEAAIVILGS